MSYGKSIGEVLYNSNHNGELYLDNERMILTSSSVFGTLRKDLIENI